MNPFIVAVGRDFFHTFVASTLRFRYRRVVSIYLVDDWVVNALGVFSGLVKLYATNFGGIDWDQTFQEFRAGRISTDR